MDTKLNVWYLKYLSIAGRTTLINSTLQTLPYYSMSSFQLHKNIHYDINRNIKRFLWNSTTDSNKTPIMHWNNIITEKNQGGMGI